ncbi:hypothetical protein EV360DRAFT_53123, partial [Lentinula raphanica]
TVVRDVKKLYAAAKERLAKDLQEYEYLLPIQLDCWTSPNHKAFMSIVTNILCKSELDGSEELTEILLAFVELLRSHSTINMAKTVIETLDEYSVHEKVSVKS